MSPGKNTLVRWMRWSGQIALFLGFSAGVILLLLWLAGKFEPKVATNTTKIQPSELTVEGSVGQVRLIRLPLTESAVGSIRAVHETSIGSKLLARVTEVNLKAGQKVKANDVLIRLDDTDLQAKIQQAKAAVTSAEALATQVAADAKRAADLIQSKAISRQDYDKAVAMDRSAKAELLRAQETIKEVQATLDWATILSPFDGIVFDKKVDVGDMVSPGQILVTLYDPKRMQLIASVRDSLAHKLQVGQDIGVQVEGLDKRCSGTVSEIVPESQSASRSFQVKVTGPCPPGIHSGMFGRIYIPLQEEQVLVIPANALRKVGQLELVRVVENGKATMRAIRTGRRINADLEVLSGLHEGEQVVIPTNAETTQEASHE
jgi:membrane fusion protein, multidrug efflux system